MPLQIYTGAGGSRFVCDSDGGFGDLVAEISIRANAPIMSCAREKGAEPFLKQLGLHSQVQLYDCYVAKSRTGVCPPECAGNCNAANPPGKSTHERRNDGIAYPQWRALFPLPVWGRGIDVERSRVPAFCDEARKEGFIVTLTYPSSVQEAQHVNFRKPPKFSIWSVRPLKLGARGPRVSLVVRLLWAVHCLDPSVRPNGRFTKQVQDAVEKFQREQHQKPDGSVGIHTITALRAARRRQAKKGATP